MTSIRPFTLSRPNELTALFSISASSHRGGLSLFQKKPPKKSSVQSIIYTFDYISWIMIFISVILVATFFMFLHKRQKINGCKKGYMVHMQMDY